MEPLAFSVFLIIAGLAIGPACYSLKITRSVSGRGSSSADDLFSQLDWELGPNQKVPRYSLQSSEAPQEKFAFIAHNPSETTAEVTMVTLFESPAFQTVCMEDFSNPYESKPIFLEVEIPNNYEILVTYTSNELESGGWMHEVDTVRCASPEVLNAEAAAPSVAHSASPTDWNSTHHSVNISYSATSYLQPAVVNSTVGLIFERTSNKTDPSTSIMFTNSATGETQVLKVYQGATKKESKSYANGKNGFCMIEDIDIICYQGLWNGDTILNYTHLELPSKVDWFAAYNLKVPAMVVATGDCQGGRCETFKIRKLEAGNKISKEVSFDNLYLACDNPSSNLQINTHGLMNKNICFDFVCTGKDLYDRKVFQFRRHCVSKDYFENN